MRYFLSMLIIFLYIVSGTPAQDESNHNWLAFQWRRDGDIHLYNAESQMLSVIDTGSLIGWTSDGQSLIYRQRWHYYRYDIDSGNAILIYEAPNEALGYIQFDSGMYTQSGFITETKIIINQAMNDSRDDCQLVVLDVYEETSYTLSDMLNSCSVSMYATENGYLLFTSTDLFELELSSFQLTEVEYVPQMEQYRLSPDRSKIMYHPVDNPYTLGIFEISDGANFTFEVSFEADYTNPYFIWSDDGERIAYIESGSQVAIFSLESGELQQIELEISVSHGLGSLRDNELTYYWYGFTRMHRETIDTTTGDRINMEMWDAVSGGGRQYPSPDNCYEFIKFPDSFSSMIRNRRTLEGIEVSIGDFVQLRIHWRPILDLTEDEKCQ